MVNPSAFAVFRLMKSWYSRAARAQVAGLRPFEICRRRSPTAEEVDEVHPVRHQAAVAREDVEWYMAGSRFRAANSMIVPRCAQKKRPSR